MDMVSSQLMIDRVMKSINKQASLMISSLIYITNFVFDFVLKCLSQHPPMTTDSLFY